MTLREELQAIPDVQHSDHSAVDALIRYITGPPEEAVQMIFVLHERYPALK